jgi:hypothetical protein
MGSGEAGVEVTILVGDAHAAAVDQVAAALAEAGLRDGRAYHETGVITGTVASRGDLDRLRSVEGVEAVEVAREYRLPDPDAPVQ